MSHHCPGRHEMRAAEGGVKVVQGDLVHQVDDLYGGCEPLFAFGMEQVLRADTDVEQAARFHAVGIVIVVLESGLGQSQERRFSHVARGIGIEGIGKSRQHAVAGEAQIDLLVRSKSERGSDIRNATDHQAALIAPDPVDVFGSFVLITEVRRILECLVVIDAEHSRRLNGYYPTGLRREIAGARMAKSIVRLEAVKVDGAQASGDSIELGIVPGNGKGNRGVEKNAEVVGVMCVLPEVIGIQQQPFADGLLKSSVELVAKAWTYGRLGIRSKYIGRKPSLSCSARQKQIFVERSLHRPRISHTPHGAGFLDVVGDTGAGLGLDFGDQSIIKVSANAQVEEEITRPDGIHRIKRILVDVVPAIEGKLRAAPAEVEGQQSRTEARVLILSRPGAIGIR